MIPFFRKIRFKLAADYQFFKYSRYAIGEIVLVVIGILIALQINNWNEEKKNHKKEIQLLLRLRSDLERDTIYFQNRMLSSEKAIQGNFKALEELYRIQDSINHIRALLQMADWGSEMLTIQNSTYEEMNNTGQIELINNIALKNEIINYYNDCTKAEKHFEEFNLYTTDFMKDMFMEVPQLQRIFPFSTETNEFYGTLDKINHDNWDIINNPDSTEFYKLEAAILVYRSKNLMFVHYFDKLIPQSKSLIELINKELKTEWS